MTIQPKTISWASRVCDREQ